MIDSSTKIVLGLFILCNSKSLFSLLPKQWKTELDNDRTMKHILCFMTIIALVMLFADYETVVDIILMSVFVEIMFLAICKLDFQWVMIVLSLLLASQMITTCGKKEIEKIDSSITLNDEEKNNLRGEYEKYIIGSHVVCAISLTLGFLLYGNKKEIQYGGGFGISEFIFG